MSYSLKRVSALLLGTLLLIAAAAPAIAAGNDITTDVYLQNTLSISGVSQDMVLLPGGGTTLSVAAQGAGLSYLWEISTDGGSTWADAPGAQNTSAYVITDAQKNDPETTPYFYRVTVTDSFGETGSEIIRVLVCDDYEYATRADVTHGVKVAGFLRKTARRMGRSAPPAKSSWSPAAIRPSTSTRKMGIESAGCWLTALEWTPMRAAIPWRIYPAASIPSLPPLNR